MMTQETEKVRKQMQKQIAKQEALFYADMLRQDINADREAHGKKPLKDNFLFGKVFLLPIRLN